MWYDVFNDIFWITIGGLFFALLNTTVKYCYKSKCENFTLCFGLLKIKRDVHAEQEIDTNNDNSDEKKEEA